MIKQLLSVALAAGLFGFSAMAQTDNPAQCPSANAQCQAAPGANNKMYQPREFTDFAFEGILLSVDQQARIDSLNAAVKANCQKGKKQCQGRQEACQGQQACQRDNAQCQAPDQCPRKGKAKCDMRSEYVKKVKEILTPEQYTVFLENIVLMPGQQPMQHPQMRRGGHHGQMQSQPAGQQPRKAKPQRQQGR